MWVAVRFEDWPDDEPTASMTTESETSFFAGR